ncbi:hypothetical protein HDU97_009864 [Phlyctochytrium planicorne]|nr:hypothetical protein HDU97_009864 [Phlyctochytrium planicorne]
MDDQINGSARGEQMCRILTTVVGLLLVALAPDGIHGQKLPLTSLAISNGVFFVTDGNNEAYQYQNSRWINISKGSNGTITNIAAYGSNSIAIVTNTQLDTARIPINPGAVGIWTHQGGIRIDKMSGNSRGELWVLQSSKTLVRWNGGFRDFTKDDQSDGKVSDLAVRDRVYTLEDGNNVCGRSFGSNSDKVCVTPQFSASKITASDSFLYVMAATGAFYATRLPLTSSSALFDTGFRSQGALYLGMPLDSNNPFIIGSNGQTDTSICSHGNVNCFTPPQAPSPNPGTPSNPSPNNPNPSNPNSPNPEPSNPTLTPPPISPSDPTLSSPNQPSKETGTEGTPITVTVTPGSPAPSFTQVNPGSSTPKETQSSASTDAPSGIPIGIIVGGVAAGIALAVIALVVAVLHRRSKSRKNDSAPPQSSAGSIHSSSSNSQVGWGEPISVPPGTFNGQRSPSRSSAFRQPTSRMQQQQQHPSFPSQPRYQNGGGGEDYRMYPVAAAASPVPSLASSNATRVAPRRGGGEEEAMVYPGVANAPPRYEVSTREQQRPDFARKIPMSF